MANKKYDYSEEVQQSAKATSETAKTSEATRITSEEARRQRLEQRNDALANEFRKLKPEIADAHKNLESLIKKLEAFTGTMINLHDLLKASFPIRLTENDRQALRKKSMLLPTMPYHVFTGNAKWRAMTFVAITIAYP